MPARKFLPQVSLRALLLATAAIAVTTYSLVAARTHELKARREAFTSNVNELMIASRYHHGVYADRFLNFIERLILEKDDQLLPPRKKMQLLQVVTGERMKRSVVGVTAHPHTSSRPSLPAVSAKLLDSAPPLVHGNCQP